MMLYTTYLMALITFQMYVVVIQKVVIAAGIKISEGYSQSQGIDLAIQKTAYDILSHQNTVSTQAIKMQLLTRVSNKI